jgi:drug/metabolite transporter (DMT)-like permease
MRKGPAAAGPFDWLLLAMLVSLGGSSFALIRTAVSTIPPQAVAVGRLWTGAVLLYLMMRLAKRKLPPFIVKTDRGPRVHLVWAHMLGVSFIGYTIPFFIFPWAQRHVASGLAGVYMAFMPIWTLGLAYLFAHETMTPGKLAGFALGFAGVLILLGPDVISGVAGSDVLAQGGLLLATLCYAISVIISRRTPPIRPRVFACATVLGAAVLSTPALLLTDLHSQSWSVASVLSIIALGIGPTGLAGLIIIILIKRAGPSFMALANYLTPLWAVAVGAALFQERLEPQALLALAVILVGVAISQRKGKLVAEAGDAQAGDLEAVADRDALQKSR